MQFIFQDPSQIINLLIRLKQDLPLAYIFITHDLAVVKHISDRVAVMYLGVIIEFAGVEELFSNPLHPYTQALISAIPRIDYRQSGRRIVLTGDVPDPSDPPSGCRSHPRCIHRMDICSQEQPQTLTLGSNGSWHTVNCHLYTDAMSR